jgi:hypothetical protein
LARMKGHAGHKKTPHWQTDAGFLTGGAAQMAPPTCSGPEASFFGGAGDSNQT